MSGSMEVMKHITIRGKRKKMRAMDGREMRQKEPEQRTVVIILLRQRQSTGGKSAEEANQSQ